MAAHKVAAVNQGSSTLTIVKVENTTTISTTNIGDSGYALFHVVKNEETGAMIPEVYFRSKEQQKSFNFPYQIGSRGDPPESAGLDMTHEF